MTPGGPINGIFDGMNGKGLGVNMLYLTETDFGTNPPADKPRISFVAWLQSIVSNYATVAEAVEGPKDNPIYFVPAHFGPGGAGHPSVHLSLSHPSGDSAMMEYLNGKVVIHHDRKFQVMANSPTYHQQLTLNSYWARIDGSKTLPSSHQSEDRFVRASYYLKRLGDTETDVRKQVAGVFSVMRNVSVPWGAPAPSARTSPPTYWRKVMDHTRKIYYFESALSPFAVAVDLNKLDNTLIFYIWGDNGSSVEGLYGTTSEQLAQNGNPTKISQHLTALEELGGLDALGGPKTDNMYHAGWACWINFHAMKLNDGVSRLILTGAIQ